MKNDGPNGFNSQRRSRPRSHRNEVNWNNVPGSQALFSTRHRQATPRFTTMPNYLPASARTRSRVAFRNPSLYAEKTESLSNSCKGFFSEHLSELRLAFSSHSSNSSGLYPYISAYLRFFINLIIIKKAGLALKGAKPGPGQTKFAWREYSEANIAFPGMACYVRCHT